MASPRPSTPVSKPNEGSSVEAPASSTTASVSTPTTPPAVSDPRSIADLATAQTSTAPPSNAPVILVSKTSISIHGDSASSTPLPPIDRWAQGVDAAYKRQGPNDLFLVPLGTAFDRITKAPDSTAIIAVDQTIPYRVLIEVLFTAGQSGFHSFSLLVRDHDKLGVLVTTPPTLGRSKPGAPGSPVSPSPQSLNLTVQLAQGGISVKAMGTSMGPDCKSPAPGLTLASQHEHRDNEGLRRCANTLRASNPQYALEKQVILMGNPDVPFSEIVAAMDALRASGFDDVQFAIAR